MLFKYENYCKIKIILEHVNNIYLAHMIVEDSILANTFLDEKYIFEQTILKLRKNKNMQQTHVLNKMTKKKLVMLCKELKIRKYSQLRKKYLIMLIQQEEYKKRSFIYLHRYLDQTEKYYLINTAKRLTVDVEKLEKKSDRILAITKLFKFISSEKMKMFIITSKPLYDATINKIEEFEKNILIQNNKQFKKYAVIIKSW